MKRALLVSVTVLAAISAEGAVAQSSPDGQGGSWGQGGSGQGGPDGQWFGPRILQGSYGFTGTAACLFAPGSASAATPGAALPNAGFQPDLRPKDAVPGSSTDAFSVSFSVEGIRTFNGDGTGTVKGTSVGITVRPTPGPSGYPSFPPSADTENFSYSFTYTVNGDGSWSSTMVPGSYTGTFVSGPRSTQNPNNTADQTSTIDAIPPIAGLISRDGSVLTGAHTDAVVETVTFSNGDVWPRICHRARVFINLPGYFGPH